MARSVMVVEDSKSMRQLVSFSLEDSGFSVVTAENGQDALDKLNGSPPSVIITDLNMPVMNGIDFIRQLRMKDGYRYLPVIMLTTESQEQKRQEGKEAGASGWMVKPFTPEQLINVVKKLAR